MHSARTPTDAIQLLNQHVRHISLEQNQVNFHIQDEKTADLVRNELAKDPRLQLNEAICETCHYAKQGVFIPRCFVITLNQQQFDTLFGKNMFAKFANINAYPSEKLIEKYLPEILKANLLLQLFKLKPSHHLLFFRFIEAYSKKFWENLLSQVPKDYLDHATNIVNAYGSNLLFETLTIKASQTNGLLFMEQISDAAFNKMIGCSETFYKLMLCNTEIFMKLINRISDDALNRNILENRNSQNNPLLAVLLHQSTEVCMTLIDRLSDDVLNQAIFGDFKTFIAGRESTALHVIFRLQPSRAWIKLINRLSDATLAKVAVMQNDDGYNPLQMALRYQPPETCITLIERLPEVILNQAVIQQTKILSALYLALCFQPSETSLRLINKISSGLVDKLILSFDSNGLNVLRAAAYYQSEEVFTTLVNKASQPQLAHAVCDARTTTLQTAAQYQSPQAFQTFLKRMNTPDGVEVLNSFLERTPLKLLHTFETIALYQTIENCQLFLSLLNENRKRALHQYCSNDHTSTRLALRAIQFKLEGEIPKTKTTAVSKELLALLDLPESKEEPQDLLNELAKIPLQKGFKFPSSEEKTAYPISEVEQQALAHFDEGVWTKIIRNDDKKDENKHNREFIEHLFHPENRQKIRDEKGINKQGFKLLLSLHRKKSDKRKPEIAYEDKRGFFSIIKADTPYQRCQHKTSKKYQDSTKHPVTFLSPDTPTGLFGYGKKRTMVGYAFTVNPDNIKFLSTQDCGTHGRWWYNEDLNQLYAMSSHTAKFVCKTFAEFQERVRQQPFAVNEALVKLNTRDLFAIVIAEDTPEARRLAIKRRLEMFYQYGKDLPIVFYNPEEQQRVKIYASAQQRQDHSKLFLDCLQKRLEEKCTPKPRKISAFFTKETVEMIEISIDFKVYSLTLQKAQQILAIIKENRDAWEKALELIMQALPVASTTKTKQMQPG